MENFKEGKVPSFKLQAFRVTGTQTLQYDDGSHSSPANEDGHIFWNLSGPGLDIHSEYPTKEKTIHKSSKFLNQISSVSLTNARE